MNHTHTPAARTNNIFHFISLYVLPLFINFWFALFWFHIRSPSHTYPDPHHRLFYESAICSDSWSSCYIFLLQSKLTASSCFVHRRREMMVLHILLLLYICMCEEPEPQPQPHTFVASLLYLLHQIFLRATAIFCRCAVPPTCTSTICAPHHSMAVAAWRSIWIKVTSQTKLPMTLAICGKLSHMRMRINRQTEERDETRCAHRQINFIVRFIHSCLSIVEFVENFHNFRLPLSSACKRRRGTYIVKSNQLELEDCIRKFPKIIGWMRMDIRHSVSLPFPKWHTQKLYYFLFVWVCVWATQDVHAWSTWQSAEVYRVRMICYSKSKSIGTCTCVCEYLFGFGFAVNRRHKYKKKKRKPMQVNMRNMVIWTRKFRWKLHFASRK